MLKRFQRRARQQLNALIVDSHDETLALDEAAGLLRDPERRGWLLGRSVRRLSFRRDLRAGMVSLGADATAQPAQPSFAAKYSSVLRRLRRFSTGTHEGDAYAVCARAAAKSLQAYGAALELELPDDIRFGLGRHYEEIDADRIELRRLRWGAEPAAPVVPPKTIAEIAALRTRNWEAEEELALDFWIGGGGRSPDPASEVSRPLRLMQP
jgi:hypothetical protein